MAQNARQPVPFLPRVILLQACIDTTRVSITGIAVFFPGYPVARLYPAGIPKAIHTVFLLQEKHPVLAFRFIALEISGITHI